MDELMTNQYAKPAFLSDATLASLPKEIARPRYDRSRLTPGIVHIGLGNFHRAHQAWYLHRLMQEGKALDWAVIGASVRKEDAPLRDKLAKQDYLTTLIELDPSGKSVEVVGSMIGYLPIEDGHAPLIAQMSEPAIRIVSLTITEGGYFLDPATKRFDLTHPDIVHDAANLHAPRTAFGAIVAALQARRTRGHSPFTCQSCDNLPGNGAILREVVTGLARLADPDLAKWIDAEVSFPNSMVDCIVPASGPRERELARSLGIADDAPVTHENFRQWVLEDEFCAGRPEWEDAGATMSFDVRAFEAQKLRLLNAGHQIIAAPAELLGLQTIAEAMAHSLIRQYFRKVALTEIVPHVAEVPGMAPVDYLDLIEHRFSNREIRDTVRRVAFDGSSRQTGAVLPTIRDAVNDGAPIEGLALSQALWMRMCRGTREDGSVIEPNDPVWIDLVRAASSAESQPSAWLQQRSFYGDLCDSGPFTDAFTAAASHIDRYGVEGAINAYLNA
ncbi:MAG: mannitol dehydrogenase family protein [Pseudomonadota bacterium]